MTRHLVVGIVAATALLFAIQDAHAQFGGLGKKLLGGGDETAEAVELPSPEQLNKDLTSIIVTNNRIVASVYSALGEKEEADQAEQNAACLEKGEGCGVADALGATQKSSKKLQEMVAAREKAGQKVEPDQMANFNSGLERLVDLVTGWKGVLASTKSVASADKREVITKYGRELVSAAAKAPPTAKTSFDMAISLYAYGRFNGIDHSESEKAAFNEAADL